MHSNDFSPNASPRKVTLHPNLQAALNNLNVSLEEELARFRQAQKQRQGITIAQAQPESSTASDHSSLTSSATRLSSANETSEQTNLDQPDSYLASSEELLRHLNQEEQEKTSLTTEPLQNKHHPTSQQTSRSSWRDYLLTPLGIAGVLIFFLSGTLLSMILINLAQARFSDDSSPVENTDSSPSAPNQQTSQSTDSSSADIPNRPNLAEDEFIELDVDNLVEAEPAEEMTTTQKPSCGANFYCVMIENPTPVEYQKTRQLFADAYLRDFPEVGQVLQVGAFKTKSQAEALQQKLDQQGITAAIYSP